LKCLFSDDLNVESLRDTDAHGHCLLQIFNSDGVDISGICLL
jgi:hypothetical protein